MSIAAIAEASALRPNTVRFHLGKLLSDGRIERVEPDHKGLGRPALMFRAIPRMDPRGPRHYRLLAEILVTHLAAGHDPPAQAVAAGRAWGQRMESAVSHGKPMGANESIEHLVAVLDELGFSPERHQSGETQQIGLRHCPFLELAEIHRGVICAIHLGLMQGALQACEASVAVARLDAFIEPDLCLTHLTQEGVAR
jgi:predicted ArsR family transcriptional regulator